MTKKHVKYIAAAVAFAAIIIAAVFAYNYLSERYEPEDLSSESGQDFDSAETKALSFTVTDTDGNKVRLSDYYGKPIILNFWATWCGPCKTELPAFNSAFSKYGDDIVFMMINLTDGYRDTVEAVDEFISENNFTFPVFYDTEYDAANAYEVESIPLTVFIDENGNVVNSHIGTMSEQTLQKYIKVLLK